MRIAQFIKVAIIVSAILLGLNIVFSLLAANARNDSNDASEMRHILAMSTYQFDFASSLMTRHARVFAVTGSDVYYAQYWALLNDDPRYTDVRNVFQSGGASRGEMLLLNGAMFLASNLRDIELLAIESQRSGDAELAMSLVFPDISHLGDRYSQLITEFSEITYTLSNMIDERTQTLIDSADTYATMYNAFARLFIILFITLSICTVIYTLFELMTALRKERETMQEMIATANREQAVGEESRSKTRFLARMSHEIRTPLNAVLGISEIQLSKNGHSAEVDEAFRRIYSSSGLLLKIINDVLDLSRVEAGKMEIINETYEVASLLIDTIQLNLVHTHHKQVEFKCTIDERIPMRLIGDETRIKQVLNNLLSNSFKYTDKGSVSFSVGIENANLPDGNITMVYTISDTGQGMTEVQLKNLFNVEFARFNVKANRSIEGSGLGLTIANQFLQMMNGDVHVESELGKGSTFTIRIPQKPDDNAVLGADVVKNLQNLKFSQMSLNKKPYHFEREPMPYGRVLVVDDVESNLYVIRGHLRPYELDLETVLCGKEAIARVEAGNKYDIIFMDYMMPDMDGVEATKILRDMGYSQPIIALTANTIKGAQELFIGNGFTDFIAKPIDVRKLDKLLLTHIRNKHEDDSEDAEFERKIKESFLRDAKKTLKIITPIIAQDIIDTGAMKVYTIQTHGIKTALANVGKTALSHAAATLETAGNNSNVQEIKSLTPEFIKNLQIVIDEMESIPVNHYMNDEDEVFLKQQFEIFAAACNDYNKKVAGGVLKKLRERTWSKETTLILSKIEALLLHGEFEEAAELAKKK